VESTDPTETEEKLSKMVCDVRAIEDKLKDGTMFIASLCFPAGAGRTVCCALAPSPLKVYWNEKPPRSLAVAAISYLLHDPNSSPFVIQVQLFRIIY
jgi:hypothetical protein